MNPKDNPREQDRHSTNSTETDENATDDDTSESMPNDTQTLRDELNTILPGSEPLQNIHAQHEGGLGYSVLSARNGGASYHYVELGDDPSCTCADMDFNVSKQNDRNVCAHVVAAMLADRLSIEQTAGQLALEMLTSLNDAVERAETAADAIKSGRVEQVDQNADSATQSASTSDDTLSPDEAQKRLEQALSNAGYEVRFIDYDSDEEKGIVFNIGHDDFEQLKKVTSQDDRVGYDGNNNRIAVDDVASYVGDL